MLQLSQKEYLDKIEGLHTELLQAWNQNQRVKALKIVIQCSKLLADTSVIKFYPSKVLFLPSFTRYVSDVGGCHQRVSITSCRSHRV